MQLPNEEILFLQIDALFRKTMQNVAKDPRVVENAGAVCKAEIKYYYFNQNIKIFNICLKFLSNLYLM